MNSSSKLEKNLTLAKSTIRETDWKLISNNDDIILESKEYPDVCSVPRFRVTGTVNGSAENLWNRVWSYTEVELKQQDPDIVFYNVIEQTENFRVYHQINKLPFPLYKREFVVAHHKIIDGNIHWIISYSIEHEKVPYNPQQYVRGIIHLAIQGFIPIDHERTQVIRIIQVDPCGNIPTVLVNMNAHKLIKGITNLKKLY